MKRKSIVLTLCVVPLLLMLGCGTVQTASMVSDNASPTTYAYDGSIISSLLDRVIASSGKVESVPVYVLSAELVRGGCLIHYDKLAYNENFVRGSSKPEEAYFLNDEELDEQTVVTDAYLNCAKVDSPFLDKSFVSYISGKKEKAPYSLYMLDGQVIFVSEIKPPA